LADKGPSCENGKETPEWPRMTMTYPLLNHARFIALLVTGEGKQDALCRVAENPDDCRNLPVALVVPTAGSRLFWFLDQAALPD
jgi:6-phosphogluconolactonase/glucosamine-6-phosphate isomerase/deaminase